METSWRRLVPRIILAAIATLLIGAVAGGTSFAVLVEEDIPAPSSGASPSPTANAGVGTASPAAVEASPSATFSATASSDATPAATNTPPPLDLTNAGPTVQVSDAPLAPEFAASTSPARSASIRTVERARDEIVSGKADEAIRSLSRGLSIDPTNPYVYFYLGRAYFMKKNYAQALTFLKRAEIGFSSNPTWLGETRGFEGAAYEESGRPAEAQVAYRQALQSAPNIRIAVAGYGRLAASGYTGAPDGVPPAVQAAPEVPAAPSGDWVIAPAPAMQPPPPPPAAEPPPPAE